ncbi:MAG: heme-binding protein [Mycobacterium sp.]
MSLLAPTVRRAVAGVFATGAIGGATLFGSAAIAVADPPPNCTAGDLAGIQSGVSAATSAYMFNHPDVNGFFTSLKGQDRDVLRNNAQNYLNANPQVQNDLQGIRQPLDDFKTRCQ